MTYRKGCGKGTSLCREWRLEKAAARVRVAWQNSDLELNVTRPSSHLITGFPRLQCPDWVLQPLLPDLPALLCHANVACAISRTHRRLAYHCSAQKPKPFLGHRHNRVRSWEIPQITGGAPGRGLVSWGNQVGSHDCHPGKRQGTMTRGGTCTPRPADKPALSCHEAYPEGCSPQGALVLAAPLDRRKPQYVSQDS